MIIFFCLECLNCPKCPNHTTIMSFGIALITILVRVADVCETVSFRFREATFRFVKTIYVVSAATTSGVSQCRDDICRQCRDLHGGSSFPQIASKHS
jgi:hypothetical protein